MMDAAMRAWHMTSDKMGAQNRWQEQGMVQGKVELQRSVLPEEV